MNDLERAWAAGLFEGEGCISFVGVNSVCLTVGMTDLDVVERFRDVVGAGTVYGPKRQAHQWKQRWDLKIAREADARRVLEAMLPWLGERRSAKARDALARLDGCRRKGFCKRGHPQNDEHVYVAPGGQRSCWTCRAIREAEREAERGRSPYLKY